MISTNLSKFIVLLILIITQGCSYLILSDYASVGFDKLELDSINSVALFDKHGRPNARILSPPSCWMMFLPFPLPSYVSSEEVLTLDGRSGRLISCSYDEWEHKTQHDRKAQTRHRYFIVSSSPETKASKKNSASDFVGSKILEIGDFLVFNHSRDGIITLILDNDNYAMFLVREGEIKNGYPYRIKYQDEFFEGWISGKNNEGVIFKKSEDENNVNSMIYLGLIENIIKEKQSLQKKNEKREIWECTNEKKTWHYRYKSKERVFTNKDGSGKCI